MAAGCMSSNSKGVKKGLEKAVKEAGLERPGRSARRRLHEIVLPGPARPGGCPTTALLPARHPEDAASVVGTLKGGQTKVQRGDPNSPFFTDQFSIVLANSGVVDPERIESYIAADGYKALHEVLREMTPKEVVETSSRAACAAAAARASRPA